MNIKELEAITGITKQNIRFYEKKGLLSPDRNPQNDYREYSEEDIERLKTIKMFRKLDLPIEDIRLILEGEIEMDSLIENHLHKLTNQETRLKTSIDICKQLIHKNLDVIDVSEVLNKMDVEEKQGGAFMNIINDYRKVAENESQKSFSFIPDTMARTKEEFTEALFQYAKENNLNLVITKESLYPEFEIDGVPFEADRIFGRFGAVIRCRMRNPDSMEVLSVPEKTRKKMKLLHRLAGPLSLSGIFLILAASRQYNPFGLLILGGIFLVFGVMISYYQNVR